MNFGKYFAFIALLVLGLFAAQSEAGFGHKLHKALHKVEHVVHETAHVAQDAGKIAAGAAAGAAAIGAIGA